MSRTAHQILGVSPDASPVEVTGAYRRLAMLHHPDRNPKRQATAHKRMVEINRAYAELTKPSASSQDLDFEFLSIDELLRGLGLAFEHNFRAKGTRMRGHRVFPNKKQNGVSTCPKCGAELKPGKRYWRCTNEECGQPWEPVY